MATSAGKAGPRQLFIVAGVTAAIVIALHFFHQLTIVLLLIYAGVLFGIFLDGVAGFICRWLPLNRLLALLFVVVLLFGLAFLFGWLAGPRISQQTADLAQQLPGSIDTIRTKLTRSDWGREVISHLPPSAQIRWPIDVLVGKLSGMFSATLEILASVVVIFFIGLYAAANPEAYVGPLTLLLPKERRRRGRQVLVATGTALRWWLLGRAIAMTVIGVLTIFALELLGLPLALTLGVIAGLLVFVPYIGAIVAAVPAMLIALTQSPVKALWVAVIYTGIHVFEGYCVTPFIQQRAISLPPALLLSVQIFVGALFGVVGVLLATPIAVAAIVLIQMLYVQDILGEEVDVIGAH
jgi:predicted PurR-regulated permease PerM